MTLGSRTSPAPIRLMWRVTLSSLPIRPPLRLAYAGCLGDDLSIEDGQASARGAMLSTLGNLAGALGSLDRIVRFVKMVGYVRATPDFGKTPTVMDGASQLLKDLFGQELLPARSAVGVSALPSGASVEIDTIVRITG